MYILPEDPDSTAAAKAWKEGLNDGCSVDVGLNVGD